MSNIDYNKIFAENAINKYNWEDSDYIKGLEILSHEFSDRFQIYLRGI